MSTYSVDTSPRHQTGSSLLCSRPGGLLPPTRSQSPLSLSLRLSASLPGSLARFQTSCDAAGGASRWRPRPQATGANKLYARATRFETRLAPANLRPLARTLARSRRPQRPTALLSGSALPATRLYAAPSSQRPAPTQHPAPQLVVCRPRRPSAASHDTAPGKPPGKLLFTCECPEQARLTTSDAHGCLENQAFHYCTLFCCTLYPYPK